MSTTNKEADQLSAETSWRTIHATMDQSHSSMYLAGTATILLLWGAIVAAGYLAMFAIDILATEFADRNPWFPAPLWAGVSVIGFIGSSIIGGRASQKITDGDSVRSAGFKVFLFFLAVLVAAFVVPAASGLWGADAANATPGVTIGIVSLGYVLFGIMTRPALAIIGILFAAAYYIPDLLLDDAAIAFTGVATLVIMFAGAIWVRKSGVA